MPTRKQLMLRFLLWMVFAVNLFHAIRVTAIWWRTPEAIGGWDWLWIALLGPLVYIYIRYFSIIGCSAGKCAAPDDTSDRESRH